jgi:hypothetical protein
LFYNYNSFTALKLKRFISKAFLIDCENKALFIIFSIINFIPPSREIIDFGLLFSYNIEKAVAKNRAFFYFKVVTISSFGLLIVSVMNWALSDVYRRAVQHLFESFIQLSFSLIDLCKKFC